MCGICGIIGGHGDATRTAVRRMMQAMVHRGPDDEGYEEFRFGGQTDTAAIGFGFRRLSILDLSSTGHQPMLDQRTGNCLVFNGEIYNFRSIRDRLASRGEHFRSSGDTEVLLKALSCWGEAALDELDGMFALAFYEARSHRVLLARDHLGIKPLYIARLPRAVVFASEVRAVLASGLVPTDLDPAGIASFLAYGAPQDPLTVHRAVRSLPAGTMQWFGAEVIEGRESNSRRRWWHFPAAGQELPVKELVDRIEGVCTESVRDQCVADVPLVVFLSSGIDSAVVAGLAARDGGPPLTFTVGNSSSAAEDETLQARETANFLHTKHYETVVDDRYVQSAWREWLIGADRPCIDGLNTWIVSHAVKAAGNTVALSGLGADELFGGYWTFDEVRRLRKMVAWLDYVPASLRRTLVPRLASLAPHKRRARILALFGRGTSYLDLTLLAHRIYGDDSLEAMGFDRRSLGLTEHWLHPDAYEPFTNLNRDLFHTVSQAEMFFYMGNTMLRDTDVNSMNCSLETRVPFLGKRLVELVAAIPGHVHLPPGPARKRLLRQVAGRLLPDRVLNRPKRGFQLPLTVWMNGPLREQCDRHVEAVATTSVIKASEARAAWHANAERPGHAAQARRLALVVLGSYLENGAATARRSST